MDLNNFYRRIVDYKETISSNVSTDLYQGLNGMDKDEINKIARIVNASFEVSFTNMIEGLQRLEANEASKPTPKKTRKRK